MSRLTAHFNLHLGAFHLDARIDTPAQGLTAIFGPSGSGKTTVLRCLAGLERAPTGVMRLGERTWQDEARNVFYPPHRRSIGYVFQEPRLFPHLSVESNLRYGWTRTPTSERYLGWDHIVDMLDLTPLLPRQPHTLSGGEQQRVAIGRALLASPRLLLMDEPLSALDRPRKREIIPFIQRLRDELSIPIIYVSHSLHEVLQLATTIALIDRGTIVAAGPVNDVFARLDLRSHMEQETIGAVLDTTIEGHEPEYGLTRLAFNGRRLFVPAQPFSVGRPLRIHILSRDVTIALGPPNPETSVLNVLEARVMEIGERVAGRPFVDLKLDVGCPLLASITRKSLAMLDLKPDQPVYAYIKAVALSHELIDA